MRYALKGNIMFMKPMGGSPSTPSVKPRGGVGGGVSIGIFGTGKTPMPKGDTPTMPTYAKGPGSSKINCPTGKCPGATRMAKL
jgi:hypothetical protein